jgi:hypothetical protein
MVKAVCIVGLSPTSRDRVFKEPPGMEMWCLNNGHICFKPEENQRFTAWFQIHPRADFEANNNPRYGNLKFLKTCGIPLYMEQVWEDIPTSVRYPQSEIIETLGYEYFTSTMAYMVALAIYQGYEEIRLYWIDMAAETEYFHERPCLEFWLGVAHSKGIGIVMPEDCPILKGKDYGHTVQVSCVKINQMLRQYEELKNTAMANFNEATGRVHMLEDLVAKDPANTMLTELLAQKRHDMVQRSAELNSHTGAVGALTDVMIEGMRPENEEAKRLRFMTGTVFNPGYVPIQHQDNKAPSLML